MKLHTNTWPPYHGEYRGGEALKFTLDKKPNEMKYSFFFLLVFALANVLNEGNWKQLKKASDEFSKINLNTKRWYPNNPKWKGRPPTYFHGSNVRQENGELVIRVNKHGKEKLPEGFTHTTGFIKSKQKFLYGYFEAEVKLMDAPWVSGFWMTNVGKDWWTEIDICENAPGLEYNRQRTLPRSGKYPLAPATGSELQLRV